MAAMIMAAMMLLYLQGYALSRQPHNSPPPDTQRHIHIREGGTQTQRRADTHRGTGGGKGARGVT